MKASWLYSKHPITIDVDLATVIGLNEAIVLQQVNYWLHTKSGKEIDGRRWVYNSYKKWQETNFPFWSEKTVKRTFTKLENKGLLLTGNFNKAGFDKTKWYSVNEKKLNEIMSQAWGQNDPTSGTNCPDGRAQIDPMEEPKLTQPIPETTRDYTETTTEKDIYSSGTPEPQDTKEKKENRIPIEEVKKILGYLNSKTGAHYKSQAKANEQKLNARWNEGYRLDDFKKVIDTKVNEWGNDEHMKKYLRPVTLFGTKFEDYVNQQSVQNTNVSTGGGYEASGPQIDENMLKDLPF